MIWISINFEQRSTCRTVTFDSFVEQSFISNCISSTDTVFVWHNRLCELHPERNPRHIPVTAGQCSENAVTTAGSVESNATCTLRGCQGEIVSCNLACFRASLISFRLGNVSHSHPPPHHPPSRIFILMRFGITIATTFFCFTSQLH